MAPELKLLASALIQSKLSERQINLTQGAKLGEFEIDDFNVNDVKKTDMGYYFSL